MILRRPDPRSESGQATVELVALFPLLTLLGLVLWQAAVAGQAVWLAGSAARAAARAQAVGSRPLDAARSVLPARLERGLAVRASPAQGSVAVSLGVPLITGHGRLLTIGSRARFAAQDG
jgi:hypothetical protein